MVKQGTRRTLLLGGLLMAAIAALAAVKFRSDPEAWPPGHTVKIPPAPMTPFSVFMAQVEEASKIADPIERCLHMPDPPGSHWHSDGVAAYCRNRYTELMDVSRFRELVAAGNGAEVDRILAGNLQTQMHDPTYASIFDQAVNRAGFHDATPETRAAINAWMRQRPDSAFAVAASGMQHRVAAFAARGNATSSKTSEEQWDAARKEAALARRDLDRAATMSPEIPTIYTDMLNVGMLIGDRRYAMAALQRGFAVQPNSLGLRLNEANLMGTRWGGSSAWVAQQAEEAAVAAKDTPLLWVAVGRARIEAATNGHVTPPADGRYLALASEVAMGPDFGSLAADANRAGNGEDAYMLAVEALRFDNARGDALYVIGYLGSRGFYPDWATAELIRAAHEHPDSVEVAGNAGVWLRYLGEPALAEPLLVYATEHGTDDWVLSTLGDFYSHEGKNYPKAASIAEELIRRDPDNANGYAIRACVQMDTNHPDRYRTLNAFLDRFGDDTEQRYTAAQMRAYLAAHPPQKG